VKYKWHFKTDEHGRFGEPEVTLVDATDLNETLTQGQFTSFVLSDLEIYAQPLHRRKQSIELALRMTNSHRDNRQDVIDTIRRNHMIRLTHPPYSPYLRSRDFCLFGALEN
jgi:hypothetical protein